LYERFGDTRFFATIGEAVKTYRERIAVDWIDWEDRA
jgi:hypothetical protein